MPAQTRDLASTVVAITGASSGIGQASARLLVEAGARVAVQARRGERLQQLVDELGSDKVIAVPGDVRDPASARGLVQAAVDGFGGWTASWSTQAWGPTVASWTRRTMS